ncbi:hypothetical protein [Novosphingobium mangrovi (ex Hu et al. 2023)]|uniref:Uncharacterized protein n=1 Tax=Novosphingobium mangrovi (ex Hu et al. 2023) TaxID=2930094 RepID=A0ABT0A7P1_9SPHN|nr:hypothetical protein [Novosphingobium mangrovi (ex Hu et al. 2023)]MCJ1959208.1 hypothetical protein [Novosphingobium mangrovi (ex Hu et al. 2023)]
MHVKTFMSVGLLSFLASFAFSHLAQAGAKGDEEVRQKAAAQERQLAARDDQGHAILP